MPRVQMQRSWPTADEVKASCSQLFNPTISPSQQIAIEQGMPGPEIGNLLNALLTTSGLLDPIGYSPVGALSVPVKGAQAAAKAVPVAKGAQKAAKAAKSVDLDSMVDDVLKMVKKNLKAKKTYDSTTEKLMQQVDAIPIDWEKIVNAQLGEPLRTPHKALKLPSGLQAKVDAAEAAGGKYPPELTSELLDFISQSPQRKDLMKWTRKPLEELAASPEVERINLFGSGATTKPNPTDFDIVVSQRPDVPIGISANANPRSMTEKIFQDMLNEVVFKHPAKGETIDVPLHMFQTGYTDPRKSWGELIQFGKERYGPVYDFLRLAGLGGLGTSAALGMNERGGYGNEQKGPASQ